MTHLNEISKIYLEKIAESAVPGKPAERLGAVTTIPKNEQEAARQRLLAKAAAKRKGMREALDPVGQEDDDIDNDGVKNDKNDKYIRNKRKAIGKAISKKKGEECDDCGKKECECDDKNEMDESVVSNPEQAKNFKKNADAMAAALQALHAKKKKKVKIRKEEVGLHEIHAQAHTTHEVPDKDLKGLVKKAVKRIDTDVDGDTDHNDKAKGELGEFIPGVGNKRLFSTSKVKTAKESFSNWRQDLIEVADEAGEKQIKEMPKNQTNKITINPKLSEAIENLGGTLLEEVELDEMDYVIDTVYDELLSEGYEEDWIEEALEYALIEATVTYGHDTDKPYEKKSGAGRLVKALGRLARKKLTDKLRNAKSKVKKAAKDALVSGARKVAAKATQVANKYDKPSQAQSKSGTRKAKTYSGAGVGRKERVSSGSYTPPTKSKPKSQGVKPADPWRGSATVPKKTEAKPAAKAPEKKTKTDRVIKKVRAVQKTGTLKKKKSSDKLDSLLASIRSEEFQLDEVKVTRIVKPEVKERAKNIKSIRDKKAALAALMKHAKLQKQGLADEVEYDGQSVDEKARNPYAIGMAAAMKSTGDTPPLKKSTITKAHKIAKKVEANESMTSEIQMNPQEILLRKKAAMVDKQLASMRERQTKQLGKNTK